MKKTQKEIQVLVIGFSTEEMRPFAKTEKVISLTSSVQNEELSKIIGCTGIEILDYDSETAIILDDQGMVKEGNPIFKVTVPDETVLYLAGTLIFAKNVYEDESVDLGGLNQKEIEWLVQNIDIKIEGMVAE